ncbi:hypothetical protein RDABS01_006400 [Bienertia sinuspersici]
MKRLKLKPKLLTCNTLLNSMVKMKRKKEMKEKGIIPSVASYNSVIAGVCKSGKTDKAIEKMNELIEKGLLPDETIYNTIIHGYRWEGKVRFHNKMVENGCKPKPNVYTCNILLRGLCSDGMLEKAIKLFHTWEGRFEDALNLVNDMIENELGPDKYTYNAFVNAGRTAEAEEFRQESYRIKSHMLKMLRRMWLEWSQFLMVKNFRRR